MTTNNSESIIDMFSTYFEFICLFVQSSYYFVMYFLDLLIIDGLFFRSINTRGFTK